MKIAINDGSTYNLADDLSQHGLDILGEKPRQAGFMGGLKDVVALAGSVVGNPGSRADVIYRVRDQATGKEHDLDAVAYLASKGMQVDNAATFKMRQAEYDAESERQNIERNDAFMKSLEGTFLQGDDKAAVDNLVARTIMPYTTKLAESGKLKTDGALKGAGRAIVAAGADFWSLLSAAPVAAFEGIRNELTGGKKGAPQPVTMMTRAQDYGPDAKPDGTQESLSEHMSNFREAFRIDPLGVAGSLAKESIKDPLTGLSVAASIGTDGAAAPLAGGRVANLVASVGKGFEKAKAAADATRFGRVMAKVAKKVEKAGVAGELAKHAAMGGIGGGAQGVLMNYAMGSDKDAWDTFVIEGVEEGAFDLLMSGAGHGFRGASRWLDLNKEDKVQALNDFRDEVQQAQAQNAPQGMLPPPAQRQLPPPYTDVQWEETPTLALPPGTEPAQGMLPPPSRGALPPGEGVIYGRPPQSVQTPDVIAQPAPRQQLQTPDVVNAPAQMARHDQAQLPRPGAVAPSAVIPNNPNVTHVMLGTGEGFDVPVDQELPPGTNRAQLLKQRNDPLFKTTAQKEAEKLREERRQMARDSVKKMAEASRQATSWVNSTYSKAVSESIAEVKAEDDAQAQASEKIVKQYTKAASEMADPTTPTSWEAWNTVMGPAHPDLDEKRAAYEKFHVDELKSIAAIKQKAKPISEGGQAEAETKPKAFDPARKAALEAKIREALQPKVEAAQQAPRERVARSSGAAFKAGDTVNLDGHTDYNVGESEILKVDERGAWFKHNGKSFFLDRNYFEKNFGPLKSKTAPRQYAPKKPVQVFDESRLDALKEKLRKRLDGNTLSSNPMFDADLMVTAIELGGIYAQKGINNFIDWADRMRQDVGDQVEPFLKSVWEAVSRHPKGTPFNPELVSQLFEYGGIMVGDSELSREKVAAGLQEAFGDAVAPYVDSVHGALAAYPKELANGTGQEAAGERGRADSARSQAGQGTDEGLQPGLRGESGRVEPGIRLDARDPSEPPLDTETAALYSAANEVEGGRIPKHLRNNLDLTYSKPVEFTPAKRREMNQQAAEVVNRVWMDPASMTEGDREIMRQYTGLGGIEAAKTTTHDEGDLGGVRFQHYTSYQVVKFAWRLADALGFNTAKRGLVGLEPTAGIGNFIGFAPRKIKWFANEVDQLSGRIMSMLYPVNESNQIGPFESWSGPKVDIVMTNVPFLKGRGPFSYLEKDPKYKEIGSLHNYIIEKGIDHLRDNGLGLFITSTGTMDAKTGTEWRRQLNHKAEVVTAIRLPEGAFKKNANYEGTVDLIVFRKRTQGEINDTPADARVQPEWVETIAVPVETKYGGKVTANRSRWYEANPDLALGEFVYGHNAGYPQTGVALPLESGETFEQGLARAFTDVLDHGAVKGAYEARAGAVEEQENPLGESAGRAREITPVGGLEVKGGKVLRKAKDGSLYPFRPEGEYNIPDEAYVLLTEIMELGERLDLAIQEGRDQSFLQGEIRARMERWQGLGYKRQPKATIGGKSVTLLPGITKKQGGSELRFYDPALMTWVDQDRRYWQISKFYNSRKDGYSSYLTEQIKMASPPKIEKGDLSKGHGLVAYVMARNGVFREDIARKEFTGTDAEFTKEMQAHPEMNWDGERWLHDREFLVGNLWPKIDAAEKAGQAKELKKLRSKLPEQKTAKTVEAAPQATWWSDEARSRFAQDMGWIGRGQHITRIPDAEGRKRFRLQNYGKADFEPTSSTLINNSLGADAFIEVVLNQEHAAAKQSYRDSEGDLHERTVADPVATAELRNAARKLFSDWASSEKGERFSGAAAVDYNRSFAGNATVDYSGEKLFIDGLVKNIRGREFVPYPHQLQAVRMALNLDGGLLAWGVGYGKTIGAVFQYAALRSAGKLKKAAFVVPGKTMFMWRDQLFEAMPGLKVKVIRGDDVNTRIPDMNDAAVNDYDAIVVSHEAFSRIPLKKAEEYINDEIEIALAGLKRLEASKKKEKAKETDAAIKRIENKIDRLKNKLRTIQEATMDPRIVTLEQWNVDHIWADEAHAYKNYYDILNEYADKQFIQSGKDSDLGNDFNYKSRYIHEKNGRGGVTLLTATPTPNKPIEIYKILKLIAPWELKNRGLETMDDFVRNFLDIGDEKTMSLDGVAGNPKEMVLGYRNLHALRDMVKSYVDVRLTPSEEVKKARPEEVHHQVYVEMSDAQQEAMAKVSTLSELKQDVLLSMGYDKMGLTTEARQIAVDPARVNPALLKEEPDFTKRSPKLGKAMENVGKRFKEHGRLQLIFLDEFKIRDVRPMLDHTGQRIKWPEGLGSFQGKKGRYVARWILSHEDPKQREHLTNLAGGQPNPATWPLKKADGSLFMPEEPSEASDIRPIFDEDGEIYVGRRVPVEDLHDRMAEHAEKKLGIPREQIAIVNGEKNAKPQEKRAIEERVDRRELKLIIGNRKALGEGMNLQTEGDAIHQIDVPWNPMPIIQSNGRLIRARGDQADNHPVSVFYYGLKGSLDAKMYEVNQQKMGWQNDLWTGNSDTLSNGLNNTEDQGFDPEEMKNALTVDNAYIAGYRTYSRIMTLKRQMAGAVKLRDQAEADMARAVTKREEAMVLIQNAQERIKAREERFAKDQAEYQRKRVQNPEREYKPPESPSHAHDQEIINKNSGLVRDIEAAIKQAEERIEPLRNAGFDVDVVGKAERMVNDVRKTKYKSMKFAEAPKLGVFAKTEEVQAAAYIQEQSNKDRERWSTFLESVFPDLFSKGLGHLADMVATKALGVKSMPADLEAQGAKVREFSKRYDLSDQAGKVSAKLMMGMGGTAFGLLFAPQATAYAGVAVGSIWALRRLSKSRMMDAMAKSVEMRLSAYQGWSYLETLITQSHQQVRQHIARDMTAFHAAFKGLSSEERELVAKKVEEPDLASTPEITAAANAWRAIAARVARAAGLPVDALYFPRMLNFEKMQALKTDPDLLQRNIDHLVKTTGLSAEDAAGLLLNMFDGSDEMRMEERIEARAAAIARIRERSPNLSDAALIAAYARMKYRFGERASGNLRYTRSAPKLLDEMYFRDPAEVVPKYLESAWRYTTYRNVFGHGNQAVNDFLDTNFPITGAEKSHERQEAEDFLNTELYGRRFKSIFGEKSQQSLLQIARKVQTYQSWTKLLLSPLSPIKNVTFAANMAAPIVGYRAMMVGIIRELAQTAQGQPFMQARTAGAITERLMRDMDETMRRAKGFAHWVTAGEYTPFMVSEKFVRAFAYHASRYHGERMFRQALEGDKTAITTLWRVLGEERLYKDMKAGKFSAESADLMALEVSDDIIGNTRALKLPYWANTPEGTILAQFRRVAYVQTVALIRQVLQPALKGNFGPLLRWGAMCGVSYLTLQYVMGAFKGDDKNDNNDQKKHASALVEFINTVNALGLYGDIAENIEQGGTAGLLKWAAGPTVNTIGNMGQAASKVLNGEDFGEEAKKLIRREAPALKRDNLFGVIPNPVAEMIKKEE